MTGGPASIHAVLRAHARSHAARAAICEPGRPALTYAGLTALVEETRERLAERSVGAGDRVAVRLDSAAATAAACVAISTGAVAIPVAGDLAGPEIERFLGATGAASVVTDDDDLAWQAEVLGLGVQRVRRAPGHAAGAFAFDAPVGPVTRAAPWGDARPDAVALVVATTGTSGAPKLVPVTARAILLTTAGAAASLELAPGDRCLNAVALHHIHGLVSGVYLPLVAAGSTVVLDGFDPAGFVAAIAERAPTWFSLSPAQHHAVLGALRQAPEAIAGHRLRFTRGGGAPMPTELALAVERAFGVPHIDSYGMSETLQISGSPVSDRRLGSVGRSIAPDLAVLDDDGRGAGTYVTGRVAVRGPMVARTYADGSPCAVTPEGWLLTGDLGWLDEDGFLYLAGRRTEWINRGGVKIAPGEIEEALMLHPDVAQAAAIAQPHPILGEDVVACVVPRPGARVSEHALLTHLRGAVAASKAPRRVVCVASLPMSSSGKVDTRALAALVGPGLAWSQAVGGAPATAAERLVMRHVAEVLDTRAIDVDDDFFELGGTSLDVVRLIAPIAERLGERLHPLTFLEHPTVRGFAAALERLWPAAIAGLDGDASGLAARPPDRAPATSAGDGFAGDFARFERDLAAHAPSASATPSATGVSPIFILSAPRSGSTLLRAVLGGHSRLFAPPELRLLAYEGLLDWRRAHAGPLEFFCEGLEAAVMHAFALDAQAAKAWIATRIRRRASVAAVYAELAGAVAPRVLVDKTPYYALFEQTLRRAEAMFDRPRFVHLTRHPVDAVRSFERTGMQQLWTYGGEPALRPRTLAECVWLRTERTIACFAAALPGDRIARVRYEDLVASPADSVARLCAALGLAFEPAMVDVGDGRPERMLDPPNPASLMIGDPDLRAAAIAPRRRAGGGAEPVALSDATREVAASLGYEIAAPPRRSAPDVPPAPAPAPAPAPSPSPSAERVLREQRRLLAAWKGTRLGTGELLVGRHLDGALPPLAWCFQSALELDRLASELGPERPLVGMRSAHLLGREPALLDALSARYVDELARAGVGREPFFLGGNCQGARVAARIAPLMQRAGTAPSALFLMEHNDAEVAELRVPFAGPVTFIFGTESHRNPARAGTATSAVRGRAYPDHRVREIPGAHGEFFAPASAPELAALLAREMSGTTAARSVAGGAAG